jgi:hypothetical protein
MAAIGLLLLANTGYFVPYSDIEAWTKKLRKLNVNTSSQFNYETHFLPLLRIILERMAFQNQVSVALPRMT